jgi:hypothetical protein
MLLLDRRVIIDGVKTRLQISHGSVYEIIHSKIGFLEDCARWVPEQLTIPHKQMRSDICQHHLDSYGKERDAFLDRLFTGDEI